MSTRQTSIRIVSGIEANYTMEARLVQRRAYQGRESAIRLGPIVFFSTITGAAWMLNPIDGRASCLALDSEFVSIPIQEGYSKFAVKWQARYRIANDSFTVIQDDGSERVFPDYPVTDIQRLIDEHPVEASAASVDTGAVAARLKNTGETIPARAAMDENTRNAACHAMSSCYARQVNASLIRCAVPNSRADVDRPAAEENWREDDDVIDIDTESEAESSPEAGAAAGWPAATRELDEDDEVKLAPEVEREAGDLWTAFDLLKHPTTEQMDAHLTRLLALPPEATNWNDVFNLFAGHEHADLAGVFRRISAGVAPTKATALSFFYWAGIEKFVSAGQSDLVPEIVAEFCTLDRETYDADALKHVEEWVLAAGCEAEALALAEHFLPVMRSDQLMPHAVPGACRTIFELRVGARLRTTVEPQADPATVARELHRDLEDEIHADYAHRAARVICGATPALVLTRRDFDLAVDEVREGEPSWQDALRRFEALMHVAREAWQIERRPPGCAFRGLWLLVDAACNEREERSPRPNKARGKGIENMLECLQPSGLERRVAENSRGLLGTDSPLAHLLLDAHANLLGFARRHALIAADLAERTERQLLQLKNKLGFPG